MVQFYPWFELCFLLFLGIVIYDNEFETKEKKIEPRIKQNHNIYIHHVVNDQTIMLNSVILYLIAAVLKGSFLCLNPPGQNVNKLIKTVKCSLITWLVTPPP